MVRSFDVDSDQSIVYKNDNTSSAHIAFVNFECFIHCRVSSQRVEVRRRNVSN